MRITGTENSNDVGTRQLSLEATRGGQPGTGQAAAGASLAIDSTAISPAASLVSQTMALPEANSSRASDVQAALSLGHFQIDNGSVATALISSMLDGAWG